MALNFKIAVDDKGNPAIEKLGGAAGKATSLMQKLGIAIAGAFAAEKIISFGVAAVKAWDDDIIAVTKLKTALGGTSDALLRQADELQKTTRFIHDGTIEAQAMLATYGLSEDQILKLIPALQNYSAATGNELAEAAEKAGRAVTTSSLAFKRQGVQVAESTSKTARLESLIGSLNQRFTGQAEALAKVGAGPLIQLKNNYGYLEDNIGKLIVEFPPFTAAVKLANEALNIAARITGEADDEYVQLAKSIDQTLLPPIIDLNEQMAKTIALAPTAGFVLGAVGKYGDPKAIDELAASFKFISAAADQTAVNIGKDIGKINKAIGADKGKAKPRKTSDQITDGKSAKEAALPAGFGIPGTAIDFEAQMATEDYLLTVESEKKKGEALKLGQQLRLDILTSGAEIEKAQLEEQITSRYALLMEDADSRIQIEQLIADGKLAIDQRYTNEVIRLERERQIAIVAGIGVMLGSFSGLNQALRGNAEFSKMLARGSVVASMAAGSMKALALEGPLGWVDFGAIIATGITQLANIDSIKFARGSRGWTVDGSGGSTSDSVPAWLSKKERVLSVDEIRRMGGNQRINDAIDAGNTGKSGFTFVNQGIILGEKEYVQDRLIPMIQTTMERE